MVKRSSENKRPGRSDLKRLGVLEDSEIDYSDIPETDALFWENAEIVLPQKKDRITIRLDRDIVQWFRGRGRGYQTRINAVLRAFVNAQGKTSG